MRSVFWGRDLDVFLWSHKVERNQKRSLSLFYENPSWILHHGNLCSSQNLISIPLWVWISTYGLYSGHIWSTALNHALNRLWVWSQQKSNREVPSLMRSSYLKKKKKTWTKRTCVSYWVLPLRSFSFHVHERNKHAPLFMKMSTQIEEKHTVNLMAMIWCRNWITKHFPGKTTLT